jgi:ribulose kinase
MATSSASGSAEHSSTGYGAPAASPASASAMLSIPEFDGNRKAFTAFDFKLKAVCYDLNLETILLKPEEYPCSSTF